MPLDAVTLSGLCRELQGELAGGRADKIYMPRPFDVVLSLRGVHGSCRLLFSAGGNAGRACLTQLRMENPETPPMFCMLLRKHMGAARIVSVTQPEYERMLVLTFTATDEMGAISEKHLICELMGRRANLILTDEGDTILACVKKVDADMSPDRQVLPGLRYHMPPRQDRKPLCALDEPGLHQLLAELCDMEQAHDYLAARLEGLSPLLLREMVFRASGSRETLERELLALAQAARSGGLTPVLLLRDGKPWDFSCLPITQYGSEVECVEKSGFSALIDDFYRDRTLEEMRKNAAGGLIRSMTAVKNRLERKLGNQRKELDTAGQRETIKKQADLITANLYAVRSGDRQVTVTDYFDETMPQVTISLDPDLSPQQNAQLLYKRYARMKNAEAALHSQIGQGERELEYVENVLYSLTQASGEKELSAIRDELTESGYVRSRDRSRKKPKPQAFRPRRFVTSDGFLVLCGRNNRENDELTMRQSQGKDLWFHVRNAPGSHVLLPLRGGEEPSQAAVEEAAAIAAFYSSLSGQPKAAVDYTEAKWVKKPQGAKPGMVNYFNFKTALVAPRDGREPESNS